MNIKNQRISGIYLYPHFPMFLAAAAFFLYLYQLGYTALMKASENGETATVEILLEAGAALDTKPRVSLLLRNLAPAPKLDP
jgi:hypothetical protein